jgi:hypothetical protein
VGRSVTKGKSSGGLNLGIGCRRQRCRTGLHPLCWVPTPAQLTVYKVEPPGDDTARLAPSTCSPKPTEAHPPTSHLPELQPDCCPTPTYPASDSTTCHTDPTLPIMAGVPGPQRTLRPRQPSLHDPDRPVRAAGMEADAARLFVESVPVKAGPRRYNPAQYTADQSNRGGGGI